MQSECSHSYIPHQEKSTVDSKNEDIRALKDDRERDNDEVDVDGYDDDTNNGTGEMSSVEWTEMEVNWIKQKPEDTGTSLLLDIHYSTDPENVQKNSIDHYCRDSWSSVALLGFINQFSAILR